MKINYTKKNYFEISLTYTIKTDSKKKSVPLRWVNVPPVTNELCIKSYGPKISNSMICAGYEKGILF